ncbi:MAG: L,D-transpeptidase [Myxococcota bacterium]
MDWALIRAQPGAGAIIGRSRSGQSLAVRVPPEAGATWIAIEPRGWVSRDDVTSDGSSPEMLRRRATVARRDAPLPYHYGFSPRVPHYRFVPTRSQQVHEERHLDPRQRPLPPLDDADEHEALWGPLFASREVPLRDGRDEANKSVWASTISLGGQRWHVTPAHTLIPAHRVEPAPPVRSPARRLPRLPFIFANGQNPGRARVFRKTRAGHYRGYRYLPRWSFIPLPQGPNWTNSPFGDLVAIADDVWLLDHEVSTFVRDPLPPDLAPGEKWVSIHLARQTLVAYRGDQPVFATAISSGADGATGRHRTNFGSFRLREKWLTQDMGGSDGGVGWRSPEVPYIAYYDAGGRALHGAWWHEWFGRPRSHGCVNLSPADAHWLFDWTEPRLPRGWHSVIAEPESGTRIVIQR